MLACSRAAPPSAGVSLVEALVALLVLSIGLLGIAGLFVESVRNSRTALLRTQAINLVGDMADRIRANATARDAYDIDATPAHRPSATARRPRPMPAANCSAAELAEDDLARWVAAVRARLAGARRMRRRRPKCITSRRRAGAPNAT